MPTPVPGTALKDFDAKWFTFTMACSCIWAFNGGYVNAVCYAGVWLTGLSHLTGSTTMSAVRFVNPPNPGQYSGWDYLGFILAWFLGALFGGIVIGNPRFRWGRLQGVLTIIHGVALILGWLLAPEPDNLSRVTLTSIFGGWLISFGMGLQNTITSLFSAMTLRTSHHSGTVLDIGITIGQCIHLRNMDHFWKLGVFPPNYIAFYVGAVAGTYAWNSLGAAAFLVNSSIAIFVGLVTLIVGTWQSYSSSTYEVVDSQQDEHLQQLRQPSKERSYTPPPLPRDGYPYEPYDPEYGGQYGGGGQPYGGTGPYGGQPYGGGYDDMPHQRYYGSI